VNVVWTVVGLTSLGTLCLKGAGPVLLGGRPLPPGLDRVIALLAPAVLAALVATNTFAAGRTLTLDARIAGMAAAFVALRLRAPTLVVVIVAAATTALVRVVS
jgi:hypothetical protein